TYPPRRRDASRLLHRRRPPTNPPPDQHLPIQDQPQRRPNQRQGRIHPASQDLAPQRHPHQQRHRRVHERIASRQRRRGVLQQPQVSVQRHQRAKHQQV